MSILANFDPHEGVLSGTTTIALKWHARKLIITNDGSSNITFKFLAAETAGTLKPTETLSVYHKTDQIILSGNVAYRIWAFG